MELHEARQHMAIALDAVRVYLEEAEARAKDAVNRENAALAAVLRFEGELKAKRQAEVAALQAQVERVQEQLQASKATLTTTTDDLNIRHDPKQ